MFLGVRDMLVRTLHFDVAFAPGEIEFFDPKLRQTSALEVVGSAELLDQTEQIRLRGRFRVRMEIDCDRCLERASFPLETRFDLFYRPASENTGADEQVIDAEESEIGFYDDGGVDLKEVMLEQVMLAMPMQRVCRPECQGICPVCGQNRNLTSCCCEVKPADDRWAALKHLVRGN